MDPRTALKDVAREARTRLAALGDSPSAARLGLLLEAGRAERALGEPGAEAALRSALDVAESLRERSLGRLAEIELGALLAARGDPGGRARLERALEGARRSNAPHEAALALAELALVHAASGDLAAADASLTAARQEGPATARARVEARAVAVARLRGGAAVPSTRAAHEAAAATTDRLERAASELALFEPGAGAVSSADLASLERNDLALLLEATAAVARAGSPAATLVERARSLLAASSVRLEERGQLLAALGEPAEEEAPSLVVRSEERTLELHGTKATPREELLARALLAHLPDATAPSPARVLAMLDRVLQAGLDLDRLVTVAIDLAVEATGAARGVLLLREPGARLGFKAARRAGGDLVDPAGVVSRSLVREVFLSGHALRLAHAALDPERGIAESVGARGLKSVLVAPIPDEEGATLGVLYLDDPGTVGRFGPAESGVAVGFAARLGGPLRNVLERSREEASAASARAALTARPERPKTRFAYPEIVGHGRALGELLALLDRAVDSNAPALISGESGTGK
ncbi:MAG TPA: GAF domain-containing protein, partial [Planctomycetota bacterium]|nr:GAF domain-containing protein [Planctomycetota bacterium]